MSTSRRDFLKRGTVVALAAGVPITIAQSALGAERSPSSAASSLNKEQFLTQLNKQFVIGQGKQQWAIKLVDVSDLKLAKGGVAPRRGGEGFTLTFKGERGLQQDTYIMENAKLGKFSMFIVPRANKDDVTVTYEAVVNRLYR
jgi:hypothetical protein